MIEISELYSIFLKHYLITTDSRDCVRDSIFFALKGQTFDGNRYAEAALQNGCAYAVVDDKDVVKDERYILVDDVLTTLQQLANYHRRTLKTKIIAITGTNGKTTTKELVASVLAKKYDVLYTSGNFNNHIGVPVTLLRLKNKHEMAVIEIGANHIGEIAHLASIVEPDFGLITNIGKAHLEGFGSLEGVTEAKKELFDYIKEHKGRVFFNTSYEILTKLSNEIDRISYAVNDNKADVTGHITQRMPFVTLVWSSPRFLVIAQKIESNMTGAYNAENLLAAIAIGLFLEVEPEDICDALNKYTPKNHRSQYLKTNKNELVVDAYNANPTSMEVALRNFAAMKFPHKTVILGDMLELGDETKKEHKKVLELLNYLKFNSIFLVGENFQYVNKDFISFANKDELIDYIKVNQISDSAILIKGSHSIGLETLADVL
jgi:UDP-N-acetylmuramoyl-tripeptide--D-alanyl-D-alanine ligase